MMPKTLSLTLTKSLRRLAVLAVAALLVTAVGTKALHAAFSDAPIPPVDESKKKKKEKKNAIEVQEQQLAQAKFLRDYRAAHEMIQAGKYEAGIAAMRALGHDAHPDVANYIGYANRKLGNYEQSKLWYEAALKADPNHTRTWSYFGMWHAEQGNRLKAQDFLTKVNTLCGDTACKEYIELKAVIDGKASY
ncbi:MAG: tetratricopeptide repeat protein [Pseudolabrys sp.]|nr:tetratricopeptide repeat protein [Pseudolabrys sp.]MDP2296730.1 tetratricopeptide repeat protein [Pseudolabrys sp.]